MVANIETMEWLTMKTLFFCLIASLSNSFLSAQLLTPAVQPEMAWKNDQVVLSDAKSFVILSPSRPEPTTIPLPPNTVDNRFAQGYFWVVQDDPSAQRLRICRSEDGHEWEYLASWSRPESTENKPARQPFYIHPLGNDMFVLVARFGGKWFTIDGKPCPIVIAKVNEKKELKIVKAVDFRFHEKLARNENGNLIINNNYIWFFSAMINRPFVTLGDQVFLAFRRAGTFIEIRPDGSIGKTLRVIPGLDEKTAIDSEQYDWAVLCSQPTKEGEILVLARTPDGVFEGRKQFPRNYSLDTMKDAEKREGTNRSDAAALKAHPLMDWWKLEPVSGKIYRTAAPTNVPVMFESIEEFRNFVFHFNPRENLIFPLLKRSK